jgi:non-hemolytic enterotoxin B/C
VSNTDFTSAVSTANTAQMSQALVIQTYASNILAQPKVDFSGLSGLSAYQAQVNDGLAKAQTHANTFLDTHEPALIDNMTAIENYYNLHTAVATSLPDGSTEDDWLQGLTALRQQSGVYQQSASDLAAVIRSFGTDLSTDAQDFSTTVTELNGAVSGDDGVLKSLDRELGSVEHSINESIAGIVGSTVGIVGGVAMICVGAATEIFTAGTSTALIVGGVGIVAGGIAGEAVFGAELADLNKQKANLISEEDELKAEVKAALGMSGNYSSLANQVGSAVTAALGMANAWQTLSGTLGGLISDLGSGVMTADKIRTIFLDAANKEIAAVLTSISTIKTQLAGVQVVTAAANENVSDLILRMVAKVSTQAANAPRAAVAA